MVMDNLRSLRRSLRNILKYNMQQKSPESDLEKTAECFIFPYMLFVEVPSLKFAQFLVHQQRHQVECPSIIDILLIGPNI